MRSLTWHGATENARVEACASSAPAWVEYSAGAVFWRGRMRESVGGGGWDLVEDALEGGLKVQVVPESVQEYDGAPGRRRAKG